MAKSMGPAELVPWVSLIISALAAWAKVDGELKLAQHRLDLQKEQFKFMREMALRAPQPMPPQFMPMPPPQMGAVPQFMPVPINPFHPLVTQVPAPANPEGNQG